MKRIKSKNLHGYRNKGGEVGRIIGVHFPKIKPQK